MPEVVGTLVGLETFGQRTEGRPEGADGAGDRLAQQRYEIGELLLDRVEVVHGPKPEVSANAGISTV